MFEWFWKYYRCLTLLLQSDGVKNDTQEEDEKSIDEILEYQEVFLILLIEIEKNEYFNKSVVYLEEIPVNIIEENGIQYIKYEVKYKNTDYIEEEFNDIVDTLSSILEYMVKLTIDVKSVQLSIVPYMQKTTGIHLNNDVCKKLFDLCGERGFDIPFTIDIDLYPMGNV